MKHYKREERRRGEAPIRASTTIESNDVKIREIKMNSYFITVPILILIIGFEFQLSILSTVKPNIFMNAKKLFPKLYVL